MVNMVNRVNMVNMVIRSPGHQVNMVRSDTWPLSILSARFYRFHVVVNVFVKKLFSGHYLTSSLIVNFKMLHMCYNPRKKSSSVNVNIMSSMCYIFNVVVVVVSVVIGFVLLSLLVLIGNLLHSM